MHWSIQAPSVIAHENTPLFYTLKLCKKKPLSRFNIIFLRDKELTKDNTNVKMVINVDYVPSTCLRFQVNCGIIKNEFEVDCKKFIIVSSISL